MHTAAIGLNRGWLSGGSCVQDIVDSLADGRGAMPARLFRLGVGALVRTD
jgi:hypothetical protein